MNLLERVIHRFFPQVGKSVTILRTLFVRRALWQSIGSGVPVDGRGGPVPWITFPALDYLSQLDFSQADVLEYGGGQSSLWWAARARTVTTVEGRAAWAEKIRAQAPRNLQVIGPVEGTEYVEAPLKDKQVFQIIVVDGLMRPECARAALPFLAEGGLLILDNADWYTPLCGWLRGEGMMQIDFHGFGPVNDYTWCTSVFMRNATVLPHLGKAWPAAEYGNLEQQS